MSNKPLSEKECFASFKAYAAYIDKEVQAGSLRGEVARALLKSARKNYSNQNYNRELRKAKCV